MQYIWLCHSFSTFPFFPSIIYFVCEVARLTSQVQSQYLTVSFDHLIVPLSLRTIGVPLETKYSDFAILRQSRLGPIDLASQLSISHTLTLTKKKVTSVDHR
jgi:hypothetical protein